MSLEKYRWFSFRSKNLFILAEKCLNLFQYPIATHFAQESIEFAGKAILEMTNKGYDPKNHDFSKAFSQLNNIYPQYQREIAKSIQMSDRWLKRSRTTSRYGAQKISPEKLDEGKRKTSLDAIKDAKKILQFLVKLERENKKDINIGILNGKVFGNRADKYPLTYRYRNLIDNNTWKKKLKSNLKSTKFNITIKEISISKIDSTIDFVINPFGEVFPNSGNDIGILNMILNFISTGGTFVNLGGLPFWSSHNVQTNEKREYIIPELGIINNKLKKSFPLKNTLSWQMLRIKTTGDTNICSGANYSPFHQEDIDIKRFGNLGRNINIHEYRGLIKSTLDFIPIIRMNRSDFGEIYPISIKQINIGYLFLASLQIENDKEVQLIIDALNGYLQWLYKKH